MSFPEVVRLLRRMIAINMANSLAYRGDFVFYMLSIVLGPVISVLIWQTAIASGAELPVDQTYLTSYFVLLGVVSMLTSAWLSMFMAEEIRNGRLSVWLARPGSFLYEMAANNLAEKAFKLVILAPMILVFGLFFRDSVSVAAPAWRWAIVALSVALAACITFSLDVIEGSLAFWIDDVSGLARARSLLVMVLAGQLVPLALMPEWARGFIDAQPFRFILSFPLEIVVGELPPGKIVSGLALQAMYTVLFVVTARAIWSRGKRSYAAVGA
jgi:ABC-2 type transport system permease protein